MTARLDLPPWLAGLVFRAQLGGMCPHVVLGALDPIVLVGGAPPMLRCGPCAIEAERNAPERHSCDICDQPSPLLHVFRGHRGQLLAAGIACPECCRAVAK
jgi:hypothetical protein